MASLIAKSPAAGLVPLKIGALTLSEETPAAITALLPYAGRSEALSEALTAAHGLALPAPNRSTAAAGLRCVWSGLDQAFLIGDAAADATLAAHAALVDQTDGWVMLRLDGDGAEAALARLTPLDLRSGVFKRGHAARSLLGHMSALILRNGPKSFSVMVFRSMAATAVHEMERTMKSIAARADAGG